MAKYEVRFVDKSGNYFCPKEFLGGPNSEPALFNTEREACDNIVDRAKYFGYQTDKYTVLQRNDDGGPVTDDPDKPNHYTRLTPEPIDVISAWGLNFSLGSAVKYIARAGYKKGEPEQVALKKAVSFLQKRIARLEGTNEAP